MSKTKIRLKEIGNVNSNSKENAKNMLKSKMNGSKKPLKIYNDSPQTRNWYTQTEISITDVAIQTDSRGELLSFSTTVDLYNDSGVGAGDLDQDAFDIMVREPIPEHYWRDLAEERRLSLAEAVAENEMLHQSVNELKEDNANLSVMASQAEYLASVLNEVLGNNDRKSSAILSDMDDSLTELSSKDPDRNIQSGECDSVAKTIAEIDNTGQCEQIVEKLQYIKGISPQ